MHTNDLKQFLKNYGTLIQYILQLKHGSIHASVMGAVNHILSEGYDEERSIRMALNKSRHLLEEMWDMEEERDSDDSSEEEDEKKTNMRESIEENI